MIKLGDIVARCLSAVGVTKQRVQDITGLADCGCKQRQEALNQAGYIAQQWLWTIRYRILHVWQNCRRNALTARLDAYWRLQKVALRALFQHR